MFSRIQDGMGRALLIVFLIKPAVDLTYFLAVPFAGTHISLLHVFAAGLFFFLLRFRFQAGANVPPFARLLEVFIALHVIAMVIGFATDGRLTIIKVVDFMLRLLDSYLIYITAFLAAIRYRYQDVSPFIKAIVIGSAFAVVLNVFSVLFHISPGVWEQKAGSATAATFRRAGLYYDPGVLANVAFFNLTFVIFQIHLAQAKSKLLVVGAIALAMMDLYLIAASKSRAVTVEMAMFGMVYLWVFQKAWGKIMAPVAAALVIGAAVVIFDIDTADLFVRFESDVTALEGESDVGISSSGQVSLGSLENIGSNRGALWAKSLTLILQQPLPTILFGNFSGSAAHSDILDILGRTGIVGLVIYLVMLVGMTAYTWRLARKAARSHDRTLYFMAFTLLLCYLFYSLPFRPLGYTTTSWYMWTVVGLAMARARLAPLEAAAAAARRRKAAEAAEPGEAAAGEGTPRRPPPLRPARPRPA